jgi:HNH endonuclease
MTEIEQFVLDNFYQKTNKEIAQELGIKIQKLRPIAYSLGLYRINLEFWNDEQVMFLRENFETIGDTELAQIFQEKFSKVKKWTKKHIEKKRKHLKLNRTPEQLKKIKQRNIDAGMYADAHVKMWNNRTQKKEGETTYWGNIRKSMYIKIQGEYKQAARYIWTQTHGEIAKGMNVAFIDGNNRNIAIENLELLSNADMARRNALISSQGLSDNYVAATMSWKDKTMRKELLKNKELLEIKRLTLKIRRLCKQKSQQ